ncbi:MULTISPECIES: hypothetical protein [Amycolatopsis]|uniref:Uncharacterized protein n=1 Tax=Amycolatopsis saalfeldensis TaxID=394193 RepID=A0A1H8YQT3_9PSEU|nr:MULTISPECIES: hypothetical protein [Amycolatopsis]SEP54453.1 hypothetical protein SAMN04489732_14729 [Amycolatopsis saalfeldensis]
MTKLSAFLNQTAVKVITSTTRYTTVNATCADCTLNVRIALATPSEAEHIENLITKHSNHAELSSAEFVHQIMNR